MRKFLQRVLIFVLLAAPSLAAAGEYHGQVTFGGLPVPGASVTATQSGKQVSTTTGPDGVFSFAELADGECSIEVLMTGFSPLQQQVTVGANAPQVKWELKLLPLGQIKAQINPPALVTRPAASQAPGQETSKAPASQETKANAGQTPAQPAGAAATPRPAAAAQASTASDQPAEALNQRAADGFLINGSSLNGASSPFAQSFAFGNNRGGRRGLYNGGIGVRFDNSALDASPYSITGVNTPKPAYNRITALATLGGPIRIPHFWPHGPNFFVNYQWTRYVNTSTDPALMPDAAERDGDFSQALNAFGQPVQIFNPATGQQFTNNMLQPGQISSQASALLTYYPLPTFSGNPSYNYQVPISTNTHQDALNTRLNHTINTKNTLFGGYAFQSTRTASPSVFGFLDTTDALGMNSNVNWMHRFSAWMFLRLGYNFSRMATTSTPYWANRENVSGQAGITGNDQAPAYWGPPTLEYSSGIAGLSDGQSSRDRNQTSALSGSLLWSRNRHNLTFGGDFRRQEFNYLSEQDPRGIFGFTGAATEGIVNGAAVGGDDFADFLLGIPDTSAIAYGNADKYFRQSVYDVYVNDDWRMSPGFTLNGGFRWEYGAPMTEIYGRLVNLDILPGFLAAAPVLGSAPTGPLTGQKYPGSLIWPDRRGFEPRLGISWRPFGGSSLLVRAGYGIYDDTSVYQTIAQQMAQQSPLSKSLSVANSPACPLTLASGFGACSTTTADTYAIDPNFRIGYAQNWQVQAQRDLPGSLQMVATYLGTKGTRGVQDFLPNTYPIGAVNPCPACPVGFSYLASNGNLTRQSGQIQLRRRLHNGLTASAMYTYAKSIDDDASVGGQGAILSQQLSSGPASGGGGNLVITQTSGAGAGGATLAQNWLNLRAERGLSTFDQRHLLNLQAQYTTGMGIGGKTLLSGWKGTLLKEWTVVTNITMGSGLPETPLYFATVPGTGVTDTIRPEVTGAPLYSAPGDLHLNPAAFAAPPSGQWGNAGRDSVTGPGEFGLNASLGRTFRLDKWNLDMRVDSTNFLNHITFTSWDATINSAQFGLPAAANPTRSMQATIRLRF